MEKPVSIIVRDLELPADAEDEIRRRAHRLERFYPRLIGCSVVVEGPGRHHREGGPYAVQLDLRVPGGEPLLVNRQRGERLDLAVGAAFDVAERRLEDYAREQRGDVKAPAAQALGRVARLFPEQGFGFLETADGREVYFHRNSVLDGFDRLAVGTAVRFHEERGLEGPQASTVEIRGQG